MLPRHLAPILKESLKHFPALLLTGPRQVGKSTLVQAIAGAAAYRTLDDRATLDAALRDPDGFLEEIGRPAVLDEVQRAPDLLRAVKLSVDRDRKPGAFLLTGSAHVLTLAKVSETLAGRVAVHELHPFSWSETERLPPSSALDDLFEAKDARALLSRWPSSVPVSRAKVRARILRGGFPTPALTVSASVRRKWFESYRQTYVERDLRDLANVAHLPDFGRFMTLLAIRTGQVLNLASVSRDLGIPYSTLQRYLSLLLQTYQAFLLLPYASSAGKRLAKAPKAYATDTGLACHLGAADDWDTLIRQQRAGPMVETWIAGELRKMASLASWRTSLWSWRTPQGREVDFLLERGEQVAGIEVKSGSGFGHSDLAGLRACREAMGRRWRFGVLLHGGTESVPLDAETVAVPYAAFLGAGG